MNYKFKTKPYAHQITALEKSWNKAHFAYFMEMGTGKSKVLIDNIAMLYDKGKINGALIVAPKGVYQNWFDIEIPNHTPTHIEKKMVLWKASFMKDNKIVSKEVDALFEIGTDLHILVMNVESLSTKNGVTFANKFLSCHETLMAIDESTTIKNPDAIRTRSIVQLGKSAKYRRILTGSPVTKSPLDLYKQCEFLNEGLLDYTSYYAFKTRYSVLRTANFGGRSVQIVVGYKNLDELSQRIEQFSYRVLKEDCLDLPSYSFTKRIIQLSKEQKKIYDSMKQIALAQLGGKLMTTATALVQLMRLHQITCGHFKSDDWNSTKN
jgi:SNF2 family DNA or RNA helicase